MQFRLGQKAKTSLHDVNFEDEEPKAKKIVLTARLPSAAKDRAGEKRGREEVANGHRHFPSSKSTIRIHKNGVAAVRNRIKLVDPVRFEQALKEFAALCADRPRVESPPTVRVTGERRCP